METVWQKYGVPIDYYFQDNFKPLYDRSSDGTSFSHHPFTLALNFGATLEKINWLISHTDNLNFSWLEESEDKHSYYGSMSTPPLFVAAGSSTTQEKEKLQMVSTLIAAKANPLLRGQDGTFDINSMYIRYVPVSVYKLMMDSVDDFSGRNDNIYKTDFVDQFLNRQISSGTGQAGIQEILQVVDVFISHGFEVPARIRRIQTSVVEQEHFARCRQALKGKLLQTEELYKKAHKECTGEVPGVREESEKQLQARTIFPRGLIYLVLDYTLMMDQSVRVKISDLTLAAREGDKKADAAQNGDS